DARQKSRRAPFGRSSRVLFRCREMVVTFGETKVTPPEGHFCRGFDILINPRINMSFGYQPPIIR
ncbi:MAG: hypothetical protein L0I62_10725, partial [Gammaproteobacteria bacterium]|nr:hypothetical protein [Gammaproteobacteria bacterium]